MTLPRSAGLGPIKRSFAAMLTSTWRCTCPGPLRFVHHVPRLALNVRTVQPRWNREWKRFQTRTATAIQSPPRLTHPSVKYYLYVISGLTFSIVVLGGLTRLTESGLSITEWQLVTGILPPIGEVQWGVELDKYKATPEGQLLNKNISMEEFKRIFLYEYSHRLLGRIIGIAFLVPIPYFIARRRITSRTGKALALLGLGLISQGVMGWYMVKSGLTQESIRAANPSGVPRVSQYRLAAHLSLAFAFYSGCLYVAMGIGKDWDVAKNGKEAATRLLESLRNPQVVRMRFLLGVLTGLVAVTALSGAFVAGLDAGLLHNTFPLMEGRFVPPTEDLLSKAYARDPDGSDLVRRNIFENPTTVQFDHRILAITTLFSAIGLWAYSRRTRHVLPRSTTRLINGTAAAAIVQASLGISTLIYLVPITLASLHQAGSLILLSHCVAALASLRLPHRSALVRAGLSSSSVARHTPAKLRR